MFFHKCIKSRSSRNAIKALKENDGWVVSPLEVRRKVVEYFKNYVAASGWERTGLEGVNFERLSNEDNGFLVAPLEEIEVVVRESDGKKSMGPDGFNFAFFFRVLVFDKG